MFGENIVWFSLGSTGMYVDDLFLSSCRCTVEEAVDNINQVLEKDSPQETFKALQHPDANLPFVYQHEAEKYHPALVSEKTHGVPQDVLVRCSIVALFPSSAVVVL